MSELSSIAMEHESSGTSNP